MTQENCNTSVTQKRNIHGRCTRIWFFERAKEICELGDDFSFDDFPEISKGNFRQIVLRNKDKIVKTNRSSFCSYKLKGYRTRGDRNNVTGEGMGVGKNMESILRNVKQQPPTVHDLKLKFESNLHSVLCSKGIIPDRTNKRIDLGKHKLQDNVVVCISVYPKIIHIDLGCTFKPIIYDIAGATEFLIFLGRIYQIIWFHGCSNEIILPNASKWIITNYHFNMDGKQEYSGEMFNRTTEDFVGGLIRYYSKHFPGGKTTCRYEEIRSPNCNVLDECYKMYWQDVHLDFITL